MSRDFTKDEVTTLARFWPRDAQEVVARELEEHIVNRLLELTDDTALRRSTFYEASSCVWSVLYALAAAEGAEGQVAGDE